MRASASWDLQSVLATAELEQRAARAPDHQRESLATMELVKALADDPKGFFQKLVDMTLSLSGADSAGISLLDEQAGRFVWPAVAGGLFPYLGEGTPREFGPCGTVLDRNEALLFRHPERHFTYLAPITPLMEEALLVPFHMHGKAVGTLWAVIHVPERKFDAEDLRLLKSLSAFAASAYRALVEAGALEPVIRRGQVSHG
jgi:GAF domain-containing protein